MLDIDELEDTQNKFVNDSNILEIDSNTLYTIESKENNNYILSYGDNNKIVVPNVLIPFWSKIGQTLYYKDGKFNRDLK